MFSALAFAVGSDHLCADTPQVSGQTSSEKALNQTTQNITEEMKSGVYTTRDQTKAATRDLSSRLKVATNDIKTVHVENVTWPDGSLGCPQKGMSYTQAMVPGVRIILSTGGQEYEYHAARSGTPLYCANPSLPVDRKK